MGKKGAGLFEPVFGLACPWSEIDAWAINPQHPAAEVRSPWVREDNTSCPWDTGEIVCAPVVRVFVSHVFESQARIYMLNKRNLVFRTAEQVSVFTLRQGSGKTNWGRNTGRRARCFFYARVAFYWDGSGRLRCHIQRIKSRFCTVMSSWNTDMSQTKNSFLKIGGQPKSPSHFTSNY